MLNRMTSEKTMHILYIHQHFAVPSGSTGTRSYEFARRWVKAGHRVTVITGHYDIGGLKYSRQPQIIDGIEVRIVGTKYSNKQSFFRRLMSFAGFVLFSFIAGMRVKNVDVIYATSTPLTIGIPAMLLKCFKRTPFVFEVRDQWPEIPIEMGMIKSKLFARMLIALERRIYKSSAAIVALSPGMAEGVRTVLKKEKQIIVAPNSSDTELFHPDIDGSEIRKKHGWKDKIVFLHFGAMGKANGLDFLLDVAENLKENNEIQFVIIGDGATKQTLVEKAASLNLTNLEFLPSVSKTDLPKYVAACDIAAVIFADYPILQHNSANKFFDSLSAGKPILLNYSGWQREIIEEAKAGLGCDLYNKDQFIGNITLLAEDQNLRKQMSQNARQLAVEKFNRDKLANQTLTVIEKVVNND